MEPEKKELWVKFDPAIPDDVQRDLFAQLAEIIRQAAGPEYAVVRIEHEPDDDEED